MDLGLRDKTVLVTAASQGLGKAVAAKFVEEGATVFICSRIQKTIQKTAGEIGATGIVCDVSSAADITAMFKQIGSVDILVTNAGGPPPGAFTDITEQQWEESFQLTFMSVVRLIQHALPHMQQQQWGRIICLTSTSVKMPIKNLIASNALRSAVAHLAKTLANEVAVDNITVNCVAPGKIYTGRITQLIAADRQSSGRSFEEEKEHMEHTIPMQRFGQVEEFANAVVWLASKPASYITGTSLSVDGGLTDSL